MGAITGAAAGDVTTDDDSIIDTSGVGFFYGGAIGTVAGAIVGVVFGAWKEIPLKHRSVVPTNDSDPSSGNDLALP